MKYPESKIIQLINDIYSGEITPYNLPEDLYFAIADYLKKGVYNAFGATLETVAEKDMELLTMLRENAFMFSAAKTFQEVKQMSELLTDGDNVRTFTEFREAAKEVFDIYNETWLKTEYDTALGQASAAVKWSEIEQNKELLPNLRYSAIIDENTSDICEPLDGLVAAVDDPIWDSVAPLNHFNCRCVLLQEDDINGPEVTPEGDKDNIVSGVEGEMQDAFKNNPGKTGVMFTQDHPYFKEVTVEDKPYAKRNFDLPIPKNDD